MLHPNPKDLWILLVVNMSSRIRGCESHNLFDEYEVEYDEIDYQCMDDVYDYEYDELCEKIEEHLIEEKIISDKIKKMRLI